MDGRAGDRVDGRGDRLAGGRLPELGRVGKTARAPPDEGRVAPEFPDDEGGRRTPPPGRVPVAGDVGRRWSVGRSEPVPALGVVGTARPRCGSAGAGATCVDGLRAPGVGVSTRVPWLGSERRGAADVGVVVGRPVGVARRSGSDGATSRRGATHARVGAAVAPDGSRYWVGRRSGGWRVLVSGAHVSPAARSLNS